MAALFADVERELGGLDVLATNAGIGGPATGIEELSFDDRSAVVSVNLHGTFVITQATVSLLKKSDAGSIVIMSSLAD